MGNDWQYLPLIKALAAVAALFHDWGKASALFQEKLDKGTLKMDPFRHEWVSCKLLEALVFAAGAEEDDRKWLKVLAEGTIKTEDIEKNLQIDEKRKRAGRYEKAGCSTFAADCKISDVVDLVSSQAAVYG